MSMRSIPGIHSHGKTDLPVLKPFNARAAGEADDLLFSRWLVSIPGYVWFMAIIGLVVGPQFAWAATSYTYSDALEALVKWMPFIVKSGFLFNVLISFYSPVHSWYSNYEFRL